MKFIFTIISILFASVATADGVTINVPPADYQDIVGGGSQKIQSNSDILITTIQAINFYIRFFLGVVTMGVIMYGGFLLMTAGGDEGTMTTANNLLYYGGIGIGICVFSFTIVRLIVRLF